MDFGSTGEAVVWLSAPGKLRGRYWRGPFLRARFFVRFEDQNRDLLCHIVFSNFHSLEALEACLEACPEVFCSNSHGLATLELETCIEACLQLYFIF